MGPGCWLRQRVSRMGANLARLGPNLKQSTADCSQVKPQILDNGFASLDRPLIDKSGLSGLFDINFLWAPLDASDDGPGRVILITGAQDQLGLKVQPAVGPVEQLVIDSAERPTPD